MARNKSGQFAKGNKYAKGKTNKKGKSTYQVYASVHERQLPKELKITQPNNFDFIRFGADNLFPQRASELHRNSSVSRAIIRSKASYVKGDGFQTDNKEFLNWQPNENENIQSIIYKGATDRYHDGNCYIEVLRSRNSELLQMYHIDSTTVRYHKDRDKVIIHPDWENYIAYKSYAITVPLYPNFELINGFERSILHLKDYERTFNLYGVPVNIGGNDASYIEYKTNKWNLSRLENEFHTSGILTVSADFSDEDAEKFDEDFKNKFIGEGNTGKPLIKVTNPPGINNDSETTYTPIETSSEGDWIDLKKEAKEELIIANQWYASLAGLDVKSGFDVNRIKNDYIVAINGVIKSEQEVFLSAIKKVWFDQKGVLLDDLAIVNKSPVPLIEQGKIDNSIITLNDKVNEGSMDIDMARNILKMSYNLTDKEVMTLWQ